MYKVVVKFREDIKDTLEQIRPRYTLKKRVYRRGGEIVESDNENEIIAIFQKEEDADFLLNSISHWKSVKKARIFHQMKDGTMVDYGFVNP